MSIDLVKYAIKNKKINLSDYELKSSPNKMFVANFIDHMITMFCWVCMSLPFGYFLNFHTMILPEAVASEVNWNILMMVTAMYPMFHILKTFAEITFMGQTFGMKLMKLV